MSPTPRDQKKMWVVDVVLRRAAEVVPVSLPRSKLPTNLESIDVVAAREIGLENLDFLEIVGRHSNMRGGFWRDLMRACDMLDSPHRMARITDHYRKALRRVGETAGSIEPKVGAGSGRETFSISNGEVCAWIDGGIHLKAATPQGDPVELSEEEARNVVNALVRFIRELDAG